MRLDTIAALAMLATPALAQDAIIQTPGQPPATVTRWGDTTIIQRSGEPATTVTRWSNTDIVQRPGEPMTTVTRFNNRENSK